MRTTMTTEDMINMKNACQDMAAALDKAISVGAETPISKDHASIVGECAIAFYALVDAITPFVSNI